MITQKPKSSNSKRLDLQGIRALAIIVVLGFHFFPDYCPNGYLGVDQFFVLSGFLMCMLLKRAENQSSCTLVTLFYSKRFKRILPLYLLLILVSMLSIAVDIFTHTWSLSVEIQFYFLVPFIFLLATKIPGNYQYFYYCILGLLSFLFAYFSIPTTAFNSVFARIWQFLIGMVVYLIESHTSVITNSDAQYQPLLTESTESDENLEPEPKQKNLTFQTTISIFLFLILIFITASTISISSHISRPLVTIGTGILMLVSENNRILSNRIFAYIGDISYSLYLIHWPIYAYWKLTCDGNQFFLVAALLSSIILAIITFEIYEKWYLQLTSISVGILVIVLFFLNVVVINKDQSQIHKVHSNDTIMVTDDMTIDDAIRMNLLWRKLDNKLLFAKSCAYESRSAPLGWCKHKGLKKSGKYKLITIGNSVNANHARVFFEECGAKANSILQGAAFGCEPLFPTYNSTACWNYYAEVEKRIKTEKPDYAFIITRFIDTGKAMPPNVTNFNADPIYQLMKDKLLKFLPHIKYKLFILDAVPRTDMEMAAKVAPLLKDGVDPVEIDKRFNWNEEWEMARKRHARLMKDCGGKCELVDYWPEFYNEETKTVRYFDKRGFIYWNRNIHLTPYGLEKIRHFWTEICGKL